MSVDDITAWLDRSDDIFETIQIGQHTVSLTPFLLESPGKVRDAFRTAVEGLDDASRHGCCPTCAGIIDERLASIRKTLGIEETEA